MKDKNIDSQLESIQLYELKHNPATAFKRQTTKLQHTFRINRTILCTGVDAIESSLLFSLLYLFSYSSWCEWA